VIAIIGAVICVIALFVALPRHCSPIRRCWKTATSRRSRGRNRDHLLAIARRLWLSERITDILITRGDALVLDATVI
jgi:hypothetical protein